MTVPDPLAVQIGGREIYDAVVRVGAAVDRLADQMTTVRADVDNHEDQLRALTNVPKQLADQETRLRTLEASRWPLPSLAAVVSLAALGLAALPLIQR